MESNYKRLKELAQKRNIEVFDEEFNLPELVNGKELRGIYYCENNDSSIIISNELDLKKKTFTMAHELGHYALHGNRQDFHQVHYHTDRDYYNKCENEADRFAAKLLQLMASSLMKTRRG